MLSRLERQEMNAFYKENFQEKTKKTTHLICGEANGSLAHNKNMITICGMPKATIGCGYNSVYSRNKELVDCAKCLNKEI